MFLLVLALAGLAAVAGSDDVDLFGMLGVVPEKEVGETRNLKWLTDLLIPAILAALVPYLAPRRLLQSGIRPTGIRDKVVYQIAASALFVGVPFLTLLYFTRENISRANQDRDGRFVEADISQTIGWGGTSEPWRRLKKVLGGVPTSAGQTALKDVEAGLERIACCDRQIDVLQANDDEQNRWYGTKPWYINLRSISELTTHSREARQARECVVASINHHLIMNKNFVRNLGGADATEPGEMINVRPASILQEIIDELQSKSSPAEQSSEEVKVSPEKRTPAAFSKKSLLDRIRLASLVASQFQKSLEGMSDHVNAGTGHRGDNTEKSLPLTHRSAERDWYRVRMTERNREVLAALVDAPGVRKSPAFGDKVQGPTAVLEVDQRWRLSWVRVSFIILITILIWCDQNSTSLNPYYEHCLQDAWIQPVTGSKGDLRINDLRNTENGQPYHLITGAAFLSAPLMNDLDDGHTPQIRRTEEFLFSRNVCGSETTGYYPTSAYDNGRMTLSSALAISGAAVAPIQHPHTMMRLICFALNLRLGRWCPIGVGKPNPFPWENEVPGLQLWVKHLCELVSGSKGKKNLCYVTDGGVHENLGIRALLKRRCRLIIGCDAGCDPAYVLEDLGHLFRWCRTQDGIVISPLPGSDFESLRPKRVPNKTAAPAPKTEESEEDEPGPLPDREWADCHFAAFEIKYPTQPGRSSEDQLPTDGLLLYFKSVMTGDEPLELREYALTHPKFPHDSTADQFYPPEQFESYRQLGFHLFDTICRGTRMDRPQDGLVRESIQQWADSRFLPGGCAKQFVEMMFKSRFFPSLDLDGTKPLPSAGFK
jgi:hypothetical protein